MPNPNDNDVPDSSDELERAAFDAAYARARLVFTEDEIANMCAWAETTLKTAIDR